MFALRKSAIAAAYLASAMASTGASAGAKDENAAEWLAPRGLNEWHDGLAAKGLNFGATWIGDDIWEQRFESIRSFEKHLARNGTVVLKFFLNVSREEQRKRFLARIDEPAKNWKFQAGDVKERERWDDYMRAYEEVIRATARKYAPWYVVPADHKWFMQLVVAAAVADALEDLDVQYPKLDAAHRRQLAAARRDLLRKK